MITNESIKRSEGVSCENRINRGKKLLKVDFSRTAEENADRATVKKPEKFWKKVTKTDGCWIISGCPSRFGYKIHSRNAAHRWAYYLTFGVIPDGMYVLHKCDNPPCVNPDHLFLGTFQDNMDDMKKKGRKAILCGEFQPGSKLTWDQVCEIRRLRASGVRSIEIGAMFGVHPNIVWRIHARRLWKHNQIIGGKKMVLPITEASAILSKP